MSPADLFTKLHLLGKLVRRSNKPFGASPLRPSPRPGCLADASRSLSAGGIQLIVSGDFFQLPPVPESRPDWRCMRCGASPSSSSSLPLVHPDLLTLAPPSDHNIIAKLDLHDACLPYEERAKPVPQADVYRCVTGTNKKGEPVGCGFEWRHRRFAFETEAWCVPLSLSLSLSRARLPDGADVLRQGRVRVQDHGAHQGASGSRRPQSARSRPLLARRSSVKTTPPSSRRSRSFGAASATRRASTSSTRAAASSARAAASRSRCARSLALSCLPSARSTR